MPISFDALNTDLDVVIIGAGISGIGAAYYLQRDCPNHQFAVLESRDSVGGTWDLFKYPGIRSDSDLYTFAYEFKPWVADESIAKADLILDYIKETAQEFHINDKICFQTRVTAANWSDDDHRWHLVVTHGETGEQRKITAKWIFSATGYYNYDHGYLPQFEGHDDFQGQVIHPQQWPEDLDYNDKHVTVIGSGATAVTLVPQLSERASHVTMLQRTPTYMMSLPTNDPIATILSKILPEKTAYALIRKKNIAIQRLIWVLSQKYPQRIKRFLINHVRKQLPDGYDVDKHFTPPYNPWDQRLCAVTNGDLFEAISAGRVSMVTDHVEHFTQSGVQLKSGEHINTDIIITATGLDIKLMGGIDITLNNKPFSYPDSVTYKGAMLSDLPNFIFATGYTNASWTLKIGLLAEYFARLLNYMHDEQFDICVAKTPDHIQTEPLLNFGAGYIQRAMDRIPKKGMDSPWELPMNYYKDVTFFRKGTLLDEHLRFE
jgi:cation diffusion facilitator CzcD-associated flavoprotein CzcO